MASDRHFHLDKIGRLLDVQVWQPIAGYYYRYASVLMRDGKVKCGVCASDIKPKLRARCSNKKCKAQVCAIRRDHASEEYLAEARHGG